MIRPSEIPTTHYLPAKHLVEEMNMNYGELKAASQFGGILVRWRSKKTRRVFYKSKNLELL